MVRQTHYIKRFGLYCYWIYTPLTIQSKYFYALSMENLEVKYFLTSLWKWTNAVKVVLCFVFSKEGEARRGTNTIEIKVTRGRRLQKQNLIDAKHKSMLKKKDQISFPTYIHSLWYIPSLLLTAVSAKRH